MLWKQEYETVLSKACLFFSVGDLSQAWEELRLSDSPHFLPTCLPAFFVPSEQNVADGETACGGGKGEACGVQIWLLPKLCPSQLPWDRTLSSLSSFNPQC